MPKPDPIEFTTEPIDLPPRFVDIGNDQWVNIDHVEFATGSDGNRTELDMVSGEHLISSLPIEVMIARLNGDQRPMTMAQPEPVDERAIEISSLLRQLDEIQAEVVGPLAETWRLRKNLRETEERYVAVQNELRVATSALILDWPR